jgi:hypothetical protein
MTNTLDKLKSEFDVILELVNKCPPPLQETALRTLLTHWLEQNAQPASAGAAPGAGSTPPATGALPVPVRTFMSANAISAELLGQVYHPAGAGAQLMASTIPGAGKATKQVNLAMLLCVRQALETGTFTCALMQLREQCVHYDCYDSTNFSASLKNNKNYFKPRSKGADLELAGPGLKKAAEIMKGIAASNG